MVKDPVCGMNIEISKAVAHEVYLGATQHFCSDSCHKKFQANPSEYVQVEITKDPVCNMDVSTSSDHHSVHADKNYYFCSSSCHQKFDAAPEQYT